MRITRILSLLCLLGILMPTWCLAASNPEAVTAIWINQSGNAIGHMTTMSENRPIGRALNGPSQGPTGNFLSGDFEGRNTNSIAFVYVDAQNSYRARISPTRQDASPRDWPIPLSLTPSTQSISVLAGDYDADGISDLAALFVAGSKLRAKIVFGPDGNRTATSATDFGSSIAYQFLSTQNKIQVKDQILLIANGTGTLRKLSRFDPIDGVQIGSSVSIGTQEASEYITAHIDDDGLSDILALKHSFGVSPAVISATTFASPNYSSGPTFTLPSGWVKLMAANVLAESLRQKDELVALEMRGTPQSPSLRASIFSLPTSGGTITNPTLMPIVGSALSTMLAGDFMAPTYKLSGKVTLPGGVGLAGVTVSIGIAQTTTNSNGTFEFSGLANGFYSIVPSLTGYTFSPELNQILISDGDRTGIDFLAISTPESGGRYTIQGQINPPAVNVSVVLLDPVRGPRAYGLSSVDGSYLITDVPRGSYILKASKTGLIFTPTERAISVTNQSISGQDFSIVDDPNAPRFRITGRMTAISGEPLRGAEVRLEPRGTIALTDELGEFSFGSIPVGNYSVIPQVADFIFQPNSRAVLLGDRDVDVGEFTARCSGNRFPVGGICRTIDPVIPRLECINLNNQGTFQAHFGYLNPNDFDIHLDNLVLNGFSPAPAERGQPKTLVSGSVWNNFVVSFDGNPLTWNLFDNSVTASINTPLCTPNTPPVVNAGGPYRGVCASGVTTVELNGTGTRDADGHKLALQWDTNCAGGVIENGNSERAKLVFSSTPQNSSCQVSLTATDQLATVQATANVDLSTCVDTNGLGPVDSCGVHNGSNSCIDCNGVPNGGANIDRCGQCGGKGLSCFGCINFDIRRQLHALDMRSIQYRDNLVRIAKKLSASLGRAKDKKSKKKKKALLQIIKTARALDSGNRKEIFSHPSTVNICPASDNCSLIDYRRLSDTIALSNKTSQRITAKLIKDKSIGGVQRKKEKRKLSQLTKAGRIALQEVPRFASTCQ